MKINNKLIVRIFIFFSLFFIQDVFLFSQSILDKNFSNYFSKEYFVIFPNWKNGFNFEQNRNIKIEDDILSLENSDDYEIKFSYLPRISVSEDIVKENSVYKYQQDMQLRLFKSEDSLVSLYKNPLGQTSRIFKEDNLVKQKKYDEKERIFEENIWDNNSQVFTLLSEKKYFYNSLDDKFSNLTELFDYKNNLKIKEFFNENNFVNKKEIYSITKKDEEENFLEELISVEKYFYDSENRIVKIVTNKKSSEVVIKYSYENNFKNPNEVIFENEIKKSEKIYSSDFDYTVEVYLDENYSIKSIYKNSIKVEESIYLDGKKIRTSREVDYE
ncbi:MAG: hypothetical protein UH788_03435 [Treponemataceae bacterium]|nr:hypothetical protein [Treponemataceae bacterium]